MTPQVAVQGPEPAPGLARDLLRLFRPRQWYKNVLLFVGLVFSLHLFNAGLAARALEGFAAFCVVASGVYALNDVIDAAEDRVHPKKRSRPVAAGRIREPVAAALGVAAICAGLGGAWLLSLPFFLVTAGYVALQVAYLLSLKHQVFLDLFSIAAGLVLRAIAGVVLVGVVLSPWLVLCTFFLALFLGLGKRRNELHVLGADAAAHRRNLGDYSQRLLDQATTVVMSALVVSYSLYTFFHENKAMMATIPFALYGLFRYLFLVSERNLGGEPEVLFKDVPSLVNLVLWGALSVAILYTGPERIAQLFAGLGSGA
jgi:4-hydroxybenzoate polyprenyltransferase